MVQQTLSPKIFNCEVTITSLTIIISAEMVWFHQASVLSNLIRYPIWREAWRKKFLS